MNGNKDTQQKTLSFSWASSKVGYTPDPVNRIKANAFVFDGNAPKAEINYSLIKIKSWQ